MRSDGVASEGPRIPRAFDCRTHQSLTDIGIRATFRDPPAAVAGGMTLVPAGVLVASRSCCIRFRVRVASRNRRASSARHRCGERSTMRHRAGLRPLPRRRTARMLISGGRGTTWPSRSPGPRCPSASLVHGRGRAQRLGDASAPRTRSRRAPIRCSSTPSIGCSWASAGSAIHSSWSVSRSSPPSRCGRGLSGSRLACLGRPDWMALLSWLRGLGSALGSQRVNSRPRRTARHQRDHGAAAPVGAVPPDGVCERRAGRLSYGQGRTRKVTTRFGLACRPCGARAPAPQA